MDPIIPPMWIYLIHLASTLRFMAIYTLCASIMILIFIYASTIEIIRDSNKKFWLRTFAITMVVCIHILTLIPDQDTLYAMIAAITMVVCILILTLIPDQDTLYAMIAASFITPDNISIGEEHLIDLVTKITKIIYNASK